MRASSTQINILTYLASPFTDPNSKKSSRGDSLYALDGVRGIAVLVVIASHTAAFGMHGQGSLGVLLFFMLSGFVLTLPYADNPKRILNRSELWRFAANRILRIVPIYLVTVLFITWLMGDKAGISWFFQNASLYKGWNHLWSVAEEARFYLLFPFMIGMMALLPNRLTRLMALAILILLSWKLRTIHQIDMMDGRFVEFYFWMFLGGSTACLLYKSKEVKAMASRSIARHLLGIISILTIILLFLSSNRMISLFWRPLIPDIPKDLSLNGWRIPEIWFFLFFVLLLSITLLPKSRGSRWLQSWFLRHLGLLSYSLYLFHMPIMLQLRHFGFRQEGLFFIVFIVTYMVALLSYLFIEKPFLMLKPKSRLAEKDKKNRDRSTSRSLL